MGADKQSQGEIAQRAKSEQTLHWLASPTSPHNSKLLITDKTFSLYFLVLADGICHNWHYCIFQPVLSPRAFQAFFVSISQACLVFFLFLPQRKWLLCLLEPPYKSWKGMWFLKWSNLVSQLCKAEGRALTEGLTLADSLYSCPKGADPWWDMCFIQQLVYS